MTNPSAATPRTLGPESIMVPATGVRAEVIEGELLLYHPAQTRAIYLNPSAAVIWGLCDGTRPVREIVELIRQSYPDANSELADDVLLTLQKLCDDRVLILSS